MISINENLLKIIRDSQSTKKNETFKLNEIIKEKESPKEEDIVLKKNVIQLKNYIVGFENPSKLFKKSWDLKRGFLLKRVEVLKLIINKNYSNKSSLRIIILLFFFLKEDIIVYLT